MNGRDRMIRIARRVVAAETGADMDEIRSLYEGGALAVKTISGISETLRKMLLDVDAYPTCISDIDSGVKCVRDIDDSSMVMDTTKNELDRMAKDIHMRYDTFHGWNSSEAKRDELKEDYFNSLSDMLAYCEGAVKSCQTFIKRTYKDDEKNVRELLDTINDSANDILNSGAGH